MLDRDTPWRQGSIISQEDAIAADLFDEDALHSKRALVVTHDCDLQNDKEPDIEIIVGEIAQTLNKQFARARNVRRLHLAFDTQSGDQFLDLQITARVSINKSVIAAARPDDSWILKDDEKRALKQWLAARYGRPAFPNAFETRLREQTGKKSTVEDLLNKALEKVSTHLIGIFFDLGKHRCMELPDGDPYTLRIAIVYDAIDGASTARLTAEAVAMEIEQIFCNAYGTPDCAVKIALESCEAVADTYFSLADLRKVDQWRVEYISLRRDPPESFLATAELPA